MARFSHRRSRVTARARKLNTVGSLVIRAYMAAKAGDARRAGRLLVKAADEDPFLIDELENATEECVDEAIEAEGCDPQDPDLAEETLEADDIIDTYVDDMMMEGAEDLIPSDEYDLNASVRRTARRMTRNRY